MSNILITPNVIINGLLSLNRQINERAFFFFFEQTMEFVVRNQHVLYMTEIDFSIINQYIFYLNRISRNIHQRQSFDLGNQRTLTEKILLIEEYINCLNQFPISRNIIDLASEYSGKINPSDAIRLAAAVSETFSESDIPIDAIVTWEPLHFCSLAKDFYFARDNGYVEVFAGESDDYDHQDQITKTIHRKTIYSPPRFISNGNFNQRKKEVQEYQYEFSLVNLIVTTTMNNNEQKNQVSVTIKCIDNKFNKQYEYTSVKKSKEGPISALFLSIYSCIGKIGLKNNLNFSNKNLEQSLVRDIIFAINPAKENNKEIFADVYLRNKNIQATEGADNVMWATAKSYIEIIKSWLIEQKIIKSIEECT